MSKSHAHEHYYNEAVVPDGSFERPWPKLTGSERPGTYYVFGMNPWGKPVVHKVRWTRDQILAAYSEVNLVPYESGSVIVHGVGFPVHGMEYNRVPSIVADVYVQSKTAQRDQHLLFRPWSAEDERQMREALMASKGELVWSRVFQTGIGLPRRRPNRRQRFVAWLMRTLRV